MLNVIMNSVIMLNVVMLSVVPPLKCKGERNIWSWIFDNLHLTQVTYFKRNPLFVLHSKTYYFKTASEQY